jgi:transposase InsO family protein
VLGMDHVPSLPRSHRGNTELLLWIDQHTGYVIVAANASRDAQTVAEAYERHVYRRFGASRIIRHDREPAFMSEVMKAFNRMIGARSKATLAYRPQSNGMTERMVQSIVHAIKLYVADPDQRDWDEYAERLVFAINSSYDRVRKETPHYLMHG